MNKTFEERYWNDADEKEKEYYALLDVVNYLKSKDENDFYALLGAWDESVMEMGNDFWNNAEAVANYAYDKETMYSEHSYFGAALLNTLKESGTIEQAIENAIDEYDHYFEDKLWESVQGGSGEGGPEIVSSYWGLEYDDLDTDYIDTVLDYCEYCGWYMKHEDLIFDQVVYCDQCRHEYEDEYGDEDDE